MLSQSIREMAVAKIMARGSVHESERDALARIEWTEANMNGAYAVLDTTNPASPMLTPYAVAALVMEMAVYCRPRHNHS